jgi:hypothetical protein
VDTERITPSRVRNERNLWVRRVSSAIMVGSLREMPRRIFVAGAEMSVIDKA